MDLVDGDKNHARLEQEDTHMLERVISGGQTGVDQAGLFAAKYSGLQTGGWMPKGFRTLTGPRPEFETMFGVKEHSSYEYSPRTEQNVIDGDGTVRIAEVFSSAGERCTLKHIKNHKKPHLDIQVILNKITFKPEIANHNIDRLKEFIQLNQIKTLNVAGNSESTSPGIYNATYAFLLLVFGELRNG